MDDSDEDKKIELVMADTKISAISGHTGFFSGRLLAAMPNHQGSFFERAVIFVCYHDDKGAMGLVLNNPMSNIDFAEILLSDAPDEERHQKIYLPVYMGGPVENERGFVLHSNDASYESTQAVGNLSMTASLDVLEDIVAGKGPAQYKFLLGYTGWGKMQLEQEYEEDSWLLLPYDSQLIFANDDSKKWHDALQLIGVDAFKLNAVGGRA